MRPSRGTHLRRRPPPAGENTAVVDGATYEWELRHGWGAAPGDGYFGVSVSVWAQRLQTRELILDFPFDRFGRDAPTPAKLLEAVSAAIAEAIIAGWDPLSRGRAKRFVPGEGRLRR